MVLEQVDEIHKSIDRYVQISNKDVVCTDTRTKQIRFKQIETRVLASVLRDQIQKLNSEIAIYRDKVRALSDNKDYVNEALKDHKEKEEKFKDACTNFRSFRLQQPEKFNDIT